MTQIYTCIYQTILQHGAASVRFAQARPNKHTSGIENHKLCEHEAGTYTSINEKIPFALSKCR